MRLHIRIVGAEQLLGAIDGQLLGLVDEFATTVVTLGRVALGVLVGEYGTLGLHHPRTGVVFRGDELDMLLLATLLRLDGREQLVVITLDTHLFAEHRPPRQCLETKTQTAPGRGRWPGTAK